MVEWGVQLYTGDPRPLEEKWEDRKMATLHCEFCGTPFETGTDKSAEQHVSWLQRIAKRHAWCERHRGQKGTPAFNPFTGNPLTGKEMDWSWKERLYGYAFLHHRMQEASLREFLTRCGLSIHESSYDECIEALDLRDKRKKPLYFIIYRKWISSPFAGTGEEWIITSNEPDDDTILAHGRGWDDPAVVDDTFARDLVGKSVCDLGAGWRMLTGDRADDAQHWARDMIAR
jgi:hypothetical protein